MKKTEEHAIEFKNVSFKKRGDSILSEVNGSFVRGKITTLVGPSGAGKTTVLKLCNNLISMVSGQIIINGKPIDSYDPSYLRQSVGIALQEAPMIRGTVKENLALPLTLQSKTLEIKEAKKLMNLVGLEQDLLERHINNLSGGQRQKLSIARTLINEPDILLLDEITSSLDKNSAEEIEELIKKINENYGVTVIWITHDISQARKIGHKVWIMISGRLVESGSIERLDYPETDHALQFLKGRQS